MSASIEEVIGDYYKDLLDYLGNIAKSNDKNELKFNMLSPSQKSDIIIKLYEFATGLNELLDSEKSFWRNKKSEGVLFLTFYILALILVFIIMMMFLFFKIKDDKKNNRNILLTLILFVIVYEIVLTIFILFIKNINSTIKLSKGQITLLEEDLNSYLNIVIKDDEMKKYFVYLGYNRKELNDKAKDYSKKIKNATYKSILTELNNEKIYNTLKDNLENFLYNFYDNGDGYLTINKTIIKSNPMLLFKETDGIIKYYNDIVLKDKLIEDPDAKNNLITELIITKLLSLLNNFQYNNNDNQSLRFNMTFKILILYLYNLSIFFYKKKSKSADDKYLKKNENTQGYSLIVKIDESSYGNIDIDNLKNEYNNIMTNLFSNNEVFNRNRDHYKEDSMSIKELIDIKTFFVPLLKKLYYDLAHEFIGTNWSYYDKNYVIFASLTPLLPNDNSSKDILDISQKIYDDYLNFPKDNIIKLKKERTIKLISNDIISFDIEILNYQSYIINNILTRKPEYSNYIDEVNEILEKVSFDIKNKKRFVKDKNMNMYISATDFINSLDNITYDNLKSNLQVNYFYDIVNNFYLETNKSINGKKHNFKNIYYEKQNIINLWNTSINMSISIIVFILIYMIISNYNTKILINTEESCNDNNEHNYRDSKLNKWIKIIVPIFIVFFIIAIMISWRNKMNSVFEYNKSVIQKNTKELAGSLKDLQDIFNDINKKLKSDGGLNINTIPDINKEDKIKIYENIKEIITSYNNCNYIIESAGADIPFPYAEVFTYLFMIIIIVIVFMYILNTVDPIKRLIEIKDMNKMKPMFFVSENIESLMGELNTRNGCHMEDMQTIMFSVKVAFVCFIVLFLSIYSVKIISGSKNYERGLFNSIYYENKKCYNK